MSASAFDPHDAPDIIDLLDLSEEPAEFLDPVADYSIPVIDDIPLPPPPPEPEDDGPVERQVDYLNLPGLRTLSESRKSETRIVVYVEQLMPTVCPACGAGTDQLKGNGTRGQLLLDEPRGSLSVLMKLRRRSYSCRVCGASKLVPLDCLAEGRRMTRRLELYIRRKSLLRPFREVAQETGVSPKTVREIFREHAAALEREREEKLPTPRVLGLDGVYINSKERAIITDPERGLVINLVPTIQAVKLGKVLSGMPGSERVEVVTIDMSKGLRLAVSDAFPHAAIVVDRYHIQRMANESVDRVRQRLRKEIKRTRGGVQMCHRKLLRKHRGQHTDDERVDVKRYFRLFPILESAYETKEAFFDIWRATGSVAAKARFDKWREACPQELKADFKPLLTAMEKWSEYVFNYFEHPHTNAFTEASNRRIKDIQREGRGGSFETVRYKAIFGTLLRQELKAAREQEPGYAKRRGTPRAKGPKPQAAETTAVAIRSRRLPVGLQLSLFAADSFSESLINHG
ncbi:MAG: ISL3 family transposase [Acidobacteria bacterium]|nr:ISL3 family transposase [Acidobacteriota bacterium]